MRYTTMSMIKRRHNPLILLMVMIFIAVGIGSACQQAAVSNPPPVLPCAQSASFFDEDFDEGMIRGTLTITAAEDESNIEYYRVFWGNALDETVDITALAEITATGSDLTHTITATIVPQEATHFLIFTANQKRIAKTTLSVAFDDRVLTQCNSINPSGDADPGQLTLAGEYCYFTADDGSHGRELWFYDGENTTIVADITAGSESTAITAMCEFNNSLLFSGANSQKITLYQCTGNTAVVADSNTPNYFAPHYLTVSGNTLFFSAADSNGDRELWQFNGTSAVRLIDINTNASSNPAFCTLLDSTGILFAADDGDNGVELWRTDGTVEGTTMVRDIASGFASSNPAGLMRYGTRVVFCADSPDYGVEVWASEGTENTTVLLADIREGVFSSDAQGFYQYKGYLYFSANDGINGTQLWRTDGTPEGTEMCAQVNVSGSSFPQQMYGYNNRIYFSATDGSGYRLWYIETASPYSATAIPVNGSGESRPRAFCEYNGLLYFTAFSDTSGSELWVSDGSIEGSVQLVDINLSGDANPASLTVYNNLLIFTADNGSNGRQLWKYRSTSDAALIQ